MSSIEFDVDSFLRSLDFAESAVRDTSLNAMNDVTDDLARVSSNIAPIDSGGLRRSADKKVFYRMNDKSIVGEVTFSASERSGGGRFNYALWTHEMEYNLGAQSLSAPGEQGMSGAYYEVGNKYLERPLLGESDAYRQYIADEIRRELGM